MRVIIWIFAFTRSLGCKHMKATSRAKQVSTRSVSNEHAVRHAQLYRLKTQDLDLRDDKPQEILKLSRIFSCKKEYGHKVVNILWKRQVERSVNVSVRDNTCSIRPKRSHTIGNVSRVKKIRGVRLRTFLFETRSYHKIPICIQISSFHVPRFI